MSYRFMFGKCGERRGSRRKSASDKASVRKLCAFLVIMFGVCGESRGSRRKSIIGTVSVTKLDRFFYRFIFGICGEIRPPSEQI